MREAEIVSALRGMAGCAVCGPHAGPVGVAVSGGGDSMACLDLMRHVAGEAGVSVKAVTVDHGLRAEAQDEIALVARYCAEHALSHDVLRWSWAGSGNLQAAARQARYRLIADWATGAGVSTVMLGHTETDVAETFLMRLARKSGVEGLAEMEQRFDRHGVSWIRPFLSASREMLRAYLRHRGVDWAEDATNDDSRFERVKARRSLEVLAPLGIDAEALSAVAQNLSIANAALNQYACEAAGRYVDEISGDLLLPCEDIGAGGQVPTETLYRLRTTALRWIGGGSYAPRSDGMIAMETAVRQGRTHSLGGCLITREESRNGPGHRWRVTREYNAVKDQSCPTDQLWDGRWVLDGPHETGLDIRALGEAVKDAPWRDTGLPRQSLLASPAIWRGEALIAAPVAGLPNGWAAQATGRGKFTDFLISR